MVANMIPPWHVRPLVRRPRLLVLAFLALGAMAITLARAGSVVPSQAPVALIVATLWPSLLRTTGRDRRRWLAIFSSYLVLLGVFMVPYFNSAMPVWYPHADWGNHEYFFDDSKRLVDFSMRGAGTWAWLVLLGFWSLLVVGFYVLDRADEAEHQPSTSATDDVLRIAGVWLAMAGALALADGLRHTGHINDFRFWGWINDRIHTCNHWQDLCNVGRRPAASCLEEAIPWCWTDRPTGPARVGAVLGATGVAVGLGAVALGLVRSSRRRAWLRMVAADRVPGWLFVPERNFALPAADEGDTEGDEKPVPRERLALVFDVEAAATYRRPHPSGLVGWVAVDAMDVGLRQSFADLYPCLRLIGLAAAITVGAGWIYQVSEILESIVVINIWGF